MDIFSGYRKIFSGSHPPGQLVLPENLKEFSMYTLSLVKSRAFKGTSRLITPPLRTPGSYAFLQVATNHQIAGFMTSA